MLKPTPENEAAYLDHLKKVVQVHIAGLNKAREQANYAVIAVFAEDILQVCKAIAETSKYLIELQGDSK